MTQSRKMKPFSLLVLLLLVQPARVSADQPTAYGLFLEALSLRDAGKATEAIKTLQKALKADPQAADAWAEIARIQQDEGRFDLAIAAVNEAVALAPARADLKSLAGQVHQFYGQSGGGEDELRIAAREYEAAAALDPNDAAPLRDLTRLYSVLRDTKAALSAWQRLAAVDPRNIDAFSQVASLSMAVGDVDGAIEALETAAAAEPQNPRVQQLLGDIKQQNGKAEEALAHYQAAASVDSKDLVTRLKIGELLLTAERSAEALVVAEDLLSEDPDNRFGLDLKARALKDQGRLDEALAIASGLAAADPKDLKTAFLVVTLLEQKGSLAEAETRLLGLLRRNTTGEDADSTTRNNRVFWAHTGMVRQRLGRFKEAAEAYGEASNARAEKDLALITYRIDALISAKEFGLALEEARAAQTEDVGKDSTDLRYLEAYALRGAGNEAAATALVDQLLAKSKGEANDILSAAEFHQRGKNMERARELFADVAQKDPGNLRAQFSLGAVLERQKKFDEAESAFRRALAIDPDSAMTLNYLGYMNADRKVRVEEALSLIEKALVSDPNNGSYLDSLAWALHRLGRNAEAETAIRKAIQSQEKNAVVMAHFGLILAERGERAEALKYLRLSLDGEDDDGELDRVLVTETIRALSQAAQKKP